MVKRSDKVMKISKDKNASNKSKQNVNSVLAKAFNSLNSLNNRNKALGIMSLFVLTISLTVLLTGKSFAAYTDWNGYTTGTVSKQDKGWKTGSFAIHIRKCPTSACSSYASYNDIVTVTVVGASGTDGSEKLRNYINNHQLGYKFSNSTTNAVQVGANSTAQYKSFKKGLRLETTANNYHFVYPYVKVLAPKGYKYLSYKVAHDSRNTDGTSLGMYQTNTPSSSIKGIFSGKAGPYASNTWVSGYMNLNNIAAGISTFKESKEHWYRTRQSANIVFIANTTKITYNANGGSGAPASQTKTYDSTLTLSSTLPTKSGYQFVKWCTAKNGTGTCYNASQVLDKQIWPTTTSVTLYAQYRAINTKCEDYQGYTYNISSASQELGYNSGYFCLHLAKNGTVYSSDKVTITPKTTGTNGSTALRTTHLCAGASSCAQRWMFSNSDDSNIKVGASPTTEYAGNKIAATGIAYALYGYVYPTLSIKIPKGYKYGTTNLGGLISFDSTLRSSASELGARLTGSPTAGISLSPLFSDLSSRGPFAEDTWINKYMSVNIYSSGLVSVKALNNSYYGIHESNNFNFIPNETTVHYNANGGTMEDEESDTMEDSIHSYDEESYISNNLYSKDGYVFKEWNTKKDGSGKRYVPNEEITTEFPTESEITLYAQWIPKYKATIYHTAKNAENETVIESEVLECIPLANKDYRIYAFHNTTSNEDYVYVTDTSGNAVSNLPLTIYTEEDDEIGHGVTDDDGKLRIDTFEDFSNNIDDVWAAVDEPYGDGVAVTLFPTNSGDSFSTSGNYKTFHGKGEKLATSCTVEIPSEVTSSKGTYNNSYAGLADRPGTVNISIDPSTTTITLTENKTYYSVYNSPVINYYYND